VIVCPIGFVADPIEVEWDLDHELRAAGAGLGLGIRAGGHANAIEVRAVAADLIDELRRP